MVMMSLTVVVDIAGFVFICSCVGGWVGGVGVCCVCMCMRACLCLFVFVHVCVCVCVCV